MFTAIQNGQLFSPRPQGKRTLLLCSGKVLKIFPDSDFDPSKFKRLGLELDLIDASGCIITPGWIDPHEHLLGGSGEDGFSTQTPELSMSEVIQAGVTTVVGCLGVDSRMKTMAGLLAKAKAFNEEGITSFIYSGGYNVPPSTIMGSLRDDILFISEVIGAGEIAISDPRCMEATSQELARLVSDAHVGGMLSRKAGITHFHVGPGRKKLSLLRSLLNDFEVRPEWIYPTHVERDKKLLAEAVALTKKGVMVDIDVSEEDLSKWLRVYLDQGASPEMLTLSSDASIKEPSTLHTQVVEAVLHNHVPLEIVLPMVTSNTARVLRLENKGRLAEGLDADVLVLDQSNLEIREVLAKGKRLLKNGSLVFSERFLEKSNRAVHLVGKAA